MLVAEKSFDSVLDDEAFWIDQRELVAKLMAPLWKAMWLEGARLAGEFSTRANKDFGEVEAAAEKFIAEYTNEWWQRVETTTRERMRQVIQEARVDGKTTQWVIDQLASLFGPERAVGIAVTEMTNLLGGGAQARYRADGWTAWEWRTVVDRRVCPECESRDGNEYPMSERFEAVHPGCRCWPVPAGVRMDADAVA